LARADPEVAATRQSKSLGILAVEREQDMPIEYDPRTSEIKYEGKVVGQLTRENGVTRVSLNITYECSPPDEWIIPLSWFGYGLGLFEKHRPKAKDAAVTLETSEADVAEEYQVPRFLTEKTVKRDGYVWLFHKSDADNWPSPLHGHDYDRNLKLDALTGDVYDVGSRHRCKRLKSDALAHIHRELRASPDFNQKLATLLPD
jgi:hypothetical protein